MSFVLIVDVLPTAFTKLKLDTTDTDILVQTVRFTTFELEWITSSIISYLGD